MTSRTARQAATEAAEQYLAMLAYDLRDRAALYFPAVAMVRFKLDPAAEEGLCGPRATSRARGYFTADEGGVIGLATVLRFEPQRRQAAVILHELGHAADHFCDPGSIGDVLGGRIGRLGAEARADAIGGFLSGQGYPLAYDGDWVQTLGPGRARPSALPR